jgi:hypothetical protein
MDKSIIIISLFLCLVQFLYADNDDAILLDQHTEITIRNNKLIKLVKYKVQINNRNGEKYADVSIPHSNLTKLSKLEASISDLQGNFIKNLKKSDITDRSKFHHFSLYEDNYVSEFTLRHNHYPYILTYSYELQQKEFIYIAYWIPLLDQDVPTLNASLTLEIPEDYEISFRNNLIIDPKIINGDKSKKYTWTASFKGLPEHEKFTPPAENFVPLVKIVPARFTFENNGSLKSWKDYGNWQYDLIRNLNDLPVDEINKINSLVRGVTDKNEKIKKLYHYLQDQTRYINITIETGGLKPYPASYVAKNKYGDCKALSNYFKSVLEIANIKSYYVNVSAGDPVDKIEQDFPSQQFNHIILCIPEENDTIWLDCTSDGPYNYLGPFTQNRFAFLIDSNDIHFVKTPLMTKEQVLCSRMIRVKPETKSLANLHFNNIYRGERFDYLFFLNRSVSQQRKEQIVKKEFVENGLDLKLWNIKESSRDSAFISLSYTAGAEKYYRRYGDELMVEILPINVPKFEIPAKREFPVQIDLPVYKIDTVDYYIPENYVVVSKPESDTVYSDYGEYNMLVMDFGNKIRIIKSFILYPGYYTNDQYKNFYNFFKMISQLENQNYIITNYQKQ